MYWYYEISNSVGFTAVKNSTTRNGDKGTDTPQGRLSWMLTGKSGGYRAGAVTNSTQLSTYRKQAYYCAVTPTAKPTVSPTPAPTGQPSRQPSSQPSSQPSRQPSGQPSSFPSGQPTGQPSRLPTLQPTGQPSRQPTGQPSRLPTGQPTSIPSSMPTIVKYRQYFLIDELQSSAFQVKDVESSAGDYDGGIAVSANRIFVTGSSRTLLLSKDLTTILAITSERLDSLVSNLKTQEVFSLADSSGKLSDSSAVFPKNVTLLKVKFHHWRRWRRDTVV